MNLTKNVCALLAIAGCGGSLQPAPESPVQVRAPQAETEETTFFDASARYGTAHALFGVTTDPHGRWSVFCQAREDTDGDGEVKVGVCGFHGELCGDELGLYLASRFNAEGDVIEVFAGASSRGDYVAYTSERVLRLRNMESGTEALLGEDVATDQNPTMGSRALSFGDGVVTYLRGDEELVLRHLEDGNEQVVPVRSGRVWRALPIGRGSLLMLAVVENDTNGNGTLDLPQVHTSLSAGPCRGQVMSYSTGGYSGDEWTRKIVRASTGEVLVEQDEILAHQGDAVIARRSDGAVEWVTAEERIESIPAACAARVLGAWERRILAVCTTEGAPSSVAIYEGGQRHDLSFEDAVDEDFPIQVRTGIRIFALETAVGGQRLIDMERRRAFPRPYGGEYGTAGDRVLRVIQGGSVELHDYVNGNTHEVLAASDNYAEGRQYTPHWSVLQIGETRSLINLDDGHIEGTFPSMPLALRSTGHGLVGGVDSEGMITGPLVWRRPDPPE